MKYWVGSISVCALSYASHYHNRRASSSYNKTVVKCLNCTHYKRHCLLGKEWYCIDTQMIDRHICFMYKGGTTFNNIYKTM